MRQYLKFFWDVIKKMAQLKFLYFVFAVILLVIFADNYSEAHKTRLRSKQASTKIESKETSGHDSDISTSKIDSLVNYALTLQGIPYQYAGKSPKGFDCSGFTFFVFNRFGIDVPAGSANQYKLGESVQLSETQKGDLIFFTGTEKGSKEVGHVGIIISAKGEEVQFIHSSSGGGGRGITINSLENPHYKARYLGVRRMFEHD